MKRFICTLTLLAAVSAIAVSCNKVPPIEPKDKDSESEPETPATKPPVDEFVLSVMSFNVAVDNRQAVNGWDDRKKAVIKMLTETKPMVIGFQEAQAHEITDMTAAHPEYAWYGIGRDTGKVPPTTTNYSAEETMAVFWIRDSLQVMDKGTFWLSETPDKLGKGWDAAYARTLTWVHFMHKGSKMKFFVFNTHLDNKGKTARSESMKLIAQKMDELNPEGLPAFLMADFNTVASDAIFAPIKGKMKSTRDVAQTSDRNKFTFNGYNAPKSQIDHIFFSGDQLTPLTFKVLDGDYGNKWISDHYPIMATYLYKRN
jgi:endonuclease/exonuclease/phosphatase family metal-dependent hydrolase